MSYILDALKKSDQERKRGNVPTLQTVHIPMNVEQQKPWGLYALIILLLLVLAFVVGMLVSGADSVTEQEVHRPAVTPEEQPGEGVIQQPKSVENITPVESTPVVKSPAIKKQSANRAQASSEVHRQQQHTKDISASQVTPRAEATRPPEVLENIDDIPYLGELPEYQQQSIPVLNFAGHVYSSTASNRSVIINGIERSQGDTIGEGLSIEKITPRGVVFRFRDTLFRVDVLQDWSFE